MHVFLSPHPDDAVLSCGGQITQLVENGERVIVFTLMAGDPPDDYPITPHTQELRERWALGDKLMEARREEDAAAVGLLGAEIAFGEFIDAPFRVNAAGKALYPNPKDIFGAVQPDDPLCQIDLSGYFSLADGDVLHAPLGVGGHVDHLITRDLALALAKHYPKARVYFYEEYPYTRQGKVAVRQALTEFNQPTMRVGRRFSDAALEAKINAIALYESQISSFWDSLDAMAEEVRDQAEGEWRLLRAEDDFSA